MDNTEKLSKMLLELWSNVAKEEEATLRQYAGRDLSVSEIHTLEAVGEGKRKTMTHVAAVLKIKISTLTAAINRLVAKGYINRFRIPEDRRVVMVELTEKGASVVREHGSFRISMINDALSQFSGEEAEKFIQSFENVNEFMLMRRINRNANDEREIKPDRIYQGGMGIGVSMSRLAAAVAICGGTGVISAFQPGFMEEDYEKDPVAANIRAIRRNVSEALTQVKKAGGKGLIGINIMSVAKNYGDYVRAAVDAGAQAVISGGGVPTALPGICRDSGVKLIPIVSSVRAASVIIRSWTKKYDRVPDAIIFEGPLAGGNLGFKEEQIGNAEENFYKTIVEIKSELESFPDCKLIVGGGIYCKQDAQKAVACGADGVEIGSRFVTTEECDAPFSFKQAYLDCREFDITTIRGISGRVDRAIKNKFIERIKKERLPIESCDGCILTCSREEARFCLKAALIRSAKGDVENGLVYCGAKTWKADKIETVKEVFDEFI